METVNKGSKGAHSTYLPVLVTDTVNTFWIIAITVNYNAACFIFEDRFTSHFSLYYKNRCSHFDGLTGKCLALCSACSYCQFWFSCSVAHFNSKHKFIKIQDHWREIVSFPTVYVIQKIIQSRPFTCVCALQKIAK